MLYVRLKAEIAERLGPRLMEWEHTLVLILFGLMMAQPWPLLGIPHEDGWGAAIFTLGVVRFAGLVVNGLLRRVTSWLRAASAIASSAIFALIWCGYLWSGNANTAAAVFLPVIAIFELFNYARAMRDVGRTA